MSKTGCNGPMVFHVWKNTEKIYTIDTHETCCGTIKAYSNTEENFGGTFFPNTVSFEFFIFFCVKKYAKERCCIEPRRFFFKRESSLLAGKNGRRIKYYLCFIIK